MFETKFIDLASRKIAADITRRQKTFLDGLTRKKRELQIAGNSPESSSGGMKIICELFQEEIRTRAIMAWDTLREVHKALGSPLTATLAADFKEMQRRFFDQRADELFVLLAKQPSWSKVYTTELYAARKNVSDELGVQIDLYVESLSQGVRDSESVKVREGGVFISHASEDVALAETVKGQIENVLARKANVFVSSVPGTIGPGSDWLDKILSHLTGNNAFVVLITHHSEKRPFVWFEIGFSWLRKIKEKCTVYALCAPPISPGSLCEPLCRLQAISLADERQTQAFFSRLVGQFGYGDVKLLEFAKIRDSLPVDSLANEGIVEERGNEGGGFASTDSDYEYADTGEVMLTAEAKEILLEAVNDRNGRIAKIRTNRGTQILTNGKDLVPDQSPRVVAKWTHALKELIDNSFIEDVGYKGEVFSVTSTGYEYADALGNDPNGSQNTKGGDPL